MIPLLKPKQAAEMLGLSRRTVYALAKTGELPSIGIGTALRFAPGDLESFVELHRRGPTPKPLRKGGGRVLSLSLPRTRRKAGDDE